MARQTIRLSPEAAQFVDTHVAATAHKVRPAQLDRLVNQAIGRHMPEEVQRLAQESWDKRHVTICDQLVSFTGTMTISAELDIADALDLDAAHAALAAVPAGAQQRADLGSSTCGPAPTATSTFATPTAPSTSPPTSPDRRPTAGLSAPDQPPEP